MYGSLRASSKTFVLKRGQQRFVLGRYPAVSLKEARAEAHRRIALKYFPSESIRAHAAIQQYLAAKKAEHRPNTQYVFQLYLARLDDLPLADINAAYLCIGAGD